MLSSLSKSGEKEKKLRFSIPVEFLNIKDKRVSQLSCFQWNLSVNLFRLGDSECTSFSFFDSEVQSFILIFPSRAESYPVHIPSYSLWWSLRHPLIGNHKKNKTKNKCQTKFGIRNRMKDSWVGLTYPFRGVFLLQYCCYVFKVYQEPFL